MWLAVIIMAPSAFSSTTAYETDGVGTKVPEMMVSTPCEAAAMAHSWPNLSEPKRVS